jgi:hypothetical protein
MKIVFAGCLGRFPIGGHAWIDMQYLAGFRELGHEVIYLEECGPESWVYNWEAEQVTSDLEYPTRYVQNCLEEIGWGDQWIYRAGEASVGMPIESFLEVCSEADLFLVRGAPISLWREEYLRPRRRIFLDVDPGFTQMDLCKRKSKFRSTVQHCERLFTIAQRMNAPDCLAPSAGLVWHKTVSPVCLSYWPWAEQAATHFATIMQWKSIRESVHQGRRYGNKNKEFPRFLDLPRQARQPFRLALTGGDPALLQEHGWETVPGWIATGTARQYQAFIQAAKAEFCVAKQGYMATQSGWFSDRSICFLACGRPALVEDTGLGDWLPTGAGLLTFRNLSEAIEGIERINSDYPAHRRAARRLAEEYFSTRTVLPGLLEAAMD